MTKEEKEAKFKYDLQQGKFGELIVRDYLQKQKWCKFVVDLSDKKEYQEKDIDFLMVTWSNEIEWVEVKTDYQAHSSGNFAYETETSNNIGCLAKTEATTIMFFVPETKRLYITKTKDLREFVEKFFGDKKPVPMGDNAKGHLLPIGNLQHYNVIWTMSIEDE